jgi:hypothetical protein
MYSSPSLILNLKQVRRSRYCRDREVRFCLRNAHFGPFRKLTVQHRLLRGSSSQYRLLSLGSIICLNISLSANLFHGALANSRDFCGGVTCPLLVGRVSSSPSRGGFLLCFLVGKNPTLPRVNEARCLIWRTAGGLRLRSQRSRPSL